VWLVFAGEKYWRMPLEEMYWESMKSPIADMKNVGTRFGGSITAALFCQQFVNTEKVPPRYSPHQPSADMGAVPDVVLV
jgi:hypothetical protein